MLAHFQVSLYSMLKCLLGLPFGVLCDNAASFPGSLEKIRHGVEIERQRGLLVLHVLHTINNCDIVYRNDGTTRSGDPRTKRSMGLA